MEENTRDAVGPAQLDAEAIDALPEGVSEALAKLDAGLEVLMGIDWLALSPGEVRATLRGITHLQTQLASTIAGYRDQAGHRMT